MKVKMKKERGENKTKITKICERKNFMLNHFKKQMENITKFEKITKLAILQIIKVSHRLEDSFYQFSKGKFQ